MNYQQHFNKLKNMFAHNPMFQNMDHKQNKAPKIHLQAFRNR